MKATIFDELVVGQAVRAKNKTYPNSDPFMKKHEGVLYITRIETFSSGRPDKYICDKAPNTDSGNYFSKEDLEAI